MKRLLALLVVGSILLAACGSETETETQSDSETETRGFSDWCNDARWVADEVDALAASSQALEERLRQQFAGELLATQIDLLRSAPSEISTIANELADGLLKVSDILVDADFVFFALTEEQLAIFESQDLEEAGDLFEAYAAQECGITDDETESAELLPLSQDEVEALLSDPERAGVLGPLMDLGVDEDMAECIMTEALLTGEGIEETVNQELVDVMIGCGLTIEQIAAIGLGVSEDEVSGTVGLDQLRTVLSPELIQALNSSQQARDAIAALLEARGLAPDDAACLVDNLADVEDVSALEELDGFVALLAGCEITLDELANLSQ